MDLYWIYTIQNKLDGKIYVGKAKNPIRRWASHISNSKKDSKHQKYIHRALKKYGIENFWFRCVGFYFSETQALAEERELIKFRNSNNAKFGYNLTEGGEGESGYKHSDETKKLLSELASKRTGENNPFYGKVHSEETTNKIRQSRRKITDNQINYLKDSYNRNLKSLKELAMDIGISVGHARDIINEKYWRK